MRKLLLLLATAIFISNVAVAQNAKLKYLIDLNDRDDDTFKVTLNVSGFSAANDLYQFASTAPGTYQIMDIGRFVRDFKAFDKKGNELKTKKIGDNQFQLTSPAKVKKITYKIAETWDTPVTEHVVYKMCGSSLEQDHALINGQCVLGYPKGMQGEPLQLTLTYPQTWTVGTALPKNNAGYYYAENYDKIVDSPILLGRLTKASTLLGKAPVDIYTYSKTDLIKSDDLLKSMETMLKAADAFIGGLPVDRYTFLFHFETESWGAWEHSYGSEYVLEEQPYTKEYGEDITSTAAHEFFHVITPLNIHSNIIESFNFVTPTPSEHLWLYEGTTEWASDIMQLRSGMMDLTTFLGEESQKLAYDANYDTKYSLSKLALTSYTPEGQQQYGNIYMRGALVATLLDIRLLELSGGKRGLREVIQTLAKQYGPHRAFPENDFFKVFTDMTYPEIGDFLNKYVKNAEPLPIEEYFQKLGIDYSPEVRSGKMISTIGVSLGVVDGKIRIAKLRDELKAAGLSEGDELVAINGILISYQNAKETLGELAAKPIGTDYNITVKRGTEELTKKCQVLSKEEVQQYLFTVDPAPTEQHLTLRSAWMKNL